jgi:hypothetical protein
MATKAFTVEGLLFVTNNYAAPLNSENAPEAFHLFQNFLLDSEISKALVEPTKLSSKQISAFWETGIYDDGGKDGTPSIVFSYEDQEYVVTPTTVRETFDFETHISYGVVGDSLLREMLQQIGYSGSLTRLGNVKRPHLRKE